MPPAIHVCRQCLYSSYPNSKSLCSTAAAISCCHYGSTAAGPSASYFLPYNPLCCGQTSKVCRRPSICCSLHRKLLAIKALFCSAQRLMQSYVTRQTHLFSQSSALVSERVPRSSPRATSSRGILQRSAYRTGSRVCAAARRLMLPPMSERTMTIPVPSLSARALNSLYLSLLVRRYSNNQDRAPMTGSTCRHSSKNCEVLTVPSCATTALARSARFTKADVITLVSRGLLTARKTRSQRHNAQVHARGQVTV